MSKFNSYPMSFANEPNIIVYENKVNLTLSKDKMSLQLYKNSLSQTISWLKVLNPKHNLESKNKQSSFSKIDLWIYSSW
jgi:hypothetical protein